MLANLLKGMAEMAVDEKTPEDEEEEISDLEDNEDDKLNLGGSPSLFRNAGPAHPIFNQLLRSVGSLYGSLEQVAAQLQN